MVGGVEPGLIGSIPGDIPLGHLDTYQGTDVPRGKGWGVITHMISRFTIEAGRAMGNQMDEGRLGQLERAAEGGAGGSGQSGNDGQTDTNTGREETG